ncbi:hypothetical protein [Natrinema halophilum]|uniref:Uncharacterized protein n=1 Tax=Natrinema halophilum TaxID=1699371 RepID=A0A7D5GR29_9EURY|nr:hypothetical protein [Natrinema halophilum]QLG47846.1 hypothetical protein HYG82_02805 [Natrinema halophilum]
MSTAEAALQLLPHHVGADRWDAWEDFNYSGTAMADANCGYGLLTPELL